MNSENLLIGSGIVLLAVSALLGFVQHRYRRQPEAFGLWRVVHAGGTAGAVQLLVLAAVWDRFEQGWTLTVLAVGLVVATYAFFLGPLARALERPRVARTFLTLGAVLALPTYVALPIVLLV